MNSQLCPGLASFIPAVSCRLPPNQVQLPGLPYRGYTTQIGPNIRYPATMELALGVAPDLLERAGDLKGELVEFARRPRFSKAFRKAVTERFGRVVVADEDELIDFMDWFVLQHRLPDGRTVVEHFVAARTDLPDAERRLLSGWRDLVEGVFEIGRRDGPALLAFNLVDELTYRMRSNMGPSIFDSMPHGGFMVCRLVPMGDEWMLSGTQRLFPRSARKAMLEMAAKLSLQHPRLVFRNREKLAQGWELQRWERERFIEWFGADLVVLDGTELGDRFDAYWAWRARQSVDGELPEGSRPNAPAFELPEHLLEAETVAVVYDEEEGLTFLAEFGRVEEVFEDPSLLANRDHRSAVLGYLNDDSVSPLPFRRLAQRDPARASEVFRRLLKKSSFCWERDGEQFMRRRKASFFARPVLPSVTPAGRAMLEMHRGSR